MRTAEQKAADRECPVCLALSRLATDGLRAATLARELHAAFAAGIHKRGVVCDEHTEAAVTKKGGV